MVEVPPQRHVVVFDCNVYLDVAHLLGEPYTRESFNKHAAQLASAPLPADDPRHDSLRAIAICTSGRFAGLETVEVWTSDHIDRMVRNKAMHPTTTDPATGFRGLGWNQGHAEALVSDLVYGACREIAREDVLCKSYCVTNDKQFLRDFRDGRLRDHTVVLTPARFVALVRAARANHATHGMRRSR